MKKDKGSELLNNDYVIPLLLRQYADFFTLEEREYFDDKDRYYNLFWNLLIEKGTLVFTIEYEGGPSEETTWVKKIGNYLYVYNEIESYGHFLLINNKKSDV